jgi:nitroreductase
MFSMPELNAKILKTLQIDNQTLKTQIMDFIKLAQNRYSSRKYKSSAVEDEKLALVLEAGRIAPSAANYQPWVFIVVRNQNMEKIQAAYPREWFKSAPVYLVICANHAQSWKRADGKDHADIDVAIAADHMTLAATSIGLATCWVCNFDKQKTIDALNLPENLEPVIILSLGYPDDLVDMGRHATKRKALSEIVFYEAYNA